MFKLIRPAFQFSQTAESHVFRRFKGHSKWQNIRHIKAAKDAQKSLANIQHVKRFQIAIAEAGGNCNPVTNDKLARAIEHARKTMLQENIDSFLKKVATEREKAEPHLVAFKGPGSSAVLVYLLTSNMKKMRMELNNVARKSNVLVWDPVPRNMFEHKGIIITNRAKSLEEATDDAIMSNAEEVEEIEDEDGKFLQFTCDPNNLSSAKNELEKCNYEVIKYEEVYIPQMTVDLSEEHSKTIEKLYTRLESLPEVFGIYSNIS